VKTTVISYTLSGNNGLLARSLAESLAAEHVRIAESGRRTTGTIAFDIMFNRTPKVTIPTLPDGSDVAVFVGPVWMGHAASPFRACFKELGPRIGKYAFVSICGGADGPNPKLSADLTERLGKEPAALVEMHKADFLPPEPKPTRKNTMVYKISGEQAKQLTARALSELSRAGLR
jgi:flavodoxin